MRLWHYDLIPYLPNSQLVAQWRELNSIYVKEDKHILINYVYEYPKINLYLYSNLVIDEMINRGINIKSFNNYNKYFEVSNPKNKISMNMTKRIFIPFENHHNDEYFKICYYNLKEKYLRGQKDFSKEQFDELNEFITFNDFVNSKEIAKRITKINDLYFCPLCGSVYVDKVPSFRYCKTCGQKLDWSEEE